jgi:hypothetical protein
MEKDKDQVVFVTVNPQKKARLDAEAKQRGTTLKHLIDHAISLLFKDLDERDASHTKSIGL